MAAPRPERNPNLGPRLTLSNYRFVPGDLEAAILGGASSRVAHAGGYIGIRGVF